MGQFIDEEPRVFFKNLKCFSKFVVILGIIMIYKGFGQFLHIRVNFLDLDVCDVSPAEYRANLLKFVY